MEASADSGPQTGTGSRLKPPFHSHISRFEEVSERLNKTELQDVLQVKQAHTITVATLNILNDARRWDERKHMIVEGFKHHRPDLIALQEVMLPVKNAEWLAGELSSSEHGHYSLHITPKTGKKHSQLEGIATLSRLPVDSAHWHDLASQNRVAQLVRVQVNGKPFIFVNGHFFWHPGDSDQRLKQIQLLKKWIDTHSDGATETGIVVCGDFNGTPESRAIASMRQHFQSAYAAVHGREPHWTCPTPLQWSTQPWRETVMNVLGLATTLKPGPWRGTLDYIFVNDQVQVEDCHLSFTAHAPHDETLFPSDHLGLVAKVRMRA